VKGFASLADYYEHSLRPRLLALQRDSDTIQAMPNLFSVLKKSGKDVKDLGTWIYYGLKIAEPIAGEIDAPLGAILTEVDSFIEKLLAPSTAVPGSTAPTLSAEQVQAVVITVAAHQAIATKVALE